MAVVWIAIVIMFIAIAVETDNYLESQRKWGENYE